MADIARLAGVTAITVSRALKDGGVVALDTRERIRRIAAAEGYRLNIDARRLRLKRSHLIAVVVEMEGTPSRHMFDPYPLGLVGGILERLTERRYSMLLTTLHTLERDGIGQIDGAILLGQGRNDAAIEAVEAYNVPFVVWGAPHDEREQVFVGSDNIAAGRMVAERFRRQGRTAPAFLGNIEHPEIGDRFAGFAAGFAEGATRLIDCDFDFAEAQARIGDYLDHGDKVDAILGANDMVAAGALRAALDRKVEVPSALSIVGFDDSPVALSTRPQLTSVAQDWSGGGIALADRILEIVDGLSPDNRALPTRLMERET